MFRVFYDVRVLDSSGKLVTKKRFAAKDAMLRFVSDKLIHRRRVRIARENVFVLTTFQNSEWGISSHTPWQKAPGPMRMAFLHHSVTKQLPVSATVEQEKEQMRLLDSIAKSRGFNGISYSWVIFPSGRCYEGRGDFVVEAATQGFNSNSDSYCFAGNCSTFALSKMQKAAVIHLINRKQGQNVLVKTGLDVRGHREVSQTSCPGTKVTNTVIATVERAVNL